MPARYEEWEILLAQCLSMMSAQSFNSDRRRRWMIWAARHQVCPECMAEVGEACVNLGDLRRGATHVKKNRHPHNKRVNLKRLRAGLTQRGYWSPVVQEMTRRRMEDPRG